MKTMKRMLSVLLAVLLAAAMTTVAFAASDRVLLSGAAGQNVTWKLTDDGVLTVSGSGPIEDEAEYEYDDDGEISCVSKQNCISWTLQAYLETLTESMDVAAAERARFDLVREIVIEEGITAVPEEEFDGFYPRKVTLPASLTALGYGAFDASFAQSVTVNSANLEHMQVRISGYRTDEEPYADLDAAIEGHIALCVAEEAFLKDLEPLYALQEIYSIEIGLSDGTDEEAVLEFYNEMLGTEAASLDELAAIAIDRFNTRFGTAYAEPADFFQIEESEWGEEIWYADGLQETYQADADSIYENGRLLTLTLGDSPEDDVKVYGWLTVTAPAGSEIEARCETTGVSFAGLCPYCHRDHSGSVWQKFVGFIHKILYFFAHLFGLK